MKLYKEPLILGIASVLGVIVVLWAIISPPKTPIATVDHLTPIPLILGNSDEDTSSSDITTSETLENESDEEPTESSPDKANETSLLPQVNPDNTQSSSKVMDDLTKPILGGTNEEN